MILKSLFLGLDNIYIDSIHLSSRQVISKGILVGVYKQKQLEIFSYSFNIQWLLTMIHTTDYKHNMVLYLPLGAIIVISFYLVWNEMSAKYMDRHLTGLESQKKSSSGKWTCDDSYGRAGLWVWYGSQDELLRISRKWAGEMRKCVLRKDAGSISALNAMENHGRILSRGMTC